MALNDVNKQFGSVNFQTKLINMMKFYSLESFLTNCRDISDTPDMSGLALSGGTLLSVLQGKKVYQPIWQIIATNNSQANGNPSSQILLSDGELLWQAIVEKKFLW